MKPQGIFTKTFENIKAFGQDVKAAAMAYDDHALEHDDAKGVSPEIEQEYFLVDRKTFKSVLEHWSEMRNVLPDGALQSSMSQDTVDALLDRAPGLSDVIKARVKAFNFSGIQESLFLNQDDTQDWKQILGDIDGMRKAYKERLKVYRGQLQEASKRSSQRSSHLNPMKLDLFLEMARFTIDALANAPVTFLGACGAGNGAAAASASALIKSSRTAVISFIAVKNFVEKNMPSVAFEKVPTSAAIIARWPELESPPLTDDALIHASELHVMPNREQLPAKIEFTDLTPADQKSFSELLTMVYDQLVKWGEQEGVPRAALVNLITEEDNLLKKYSGINVRELVSPDHFKLKAVGKAEAITFGYLWNRAVEMMKKHGEEPIIPPPVGETVPWNQVQQFNPSEEHYTSFVASGRYESIVAALKKFKKIDEVFDVKIDTEADLREKAELVVVGRCKGDFEIGYRQHGAVKQRTSVVTAWRLKQEVEPAKGPAAAEARESTPGQPFTAATDGGVEQKRIKDIEKLQRTLQIVRSQINRADESLKPLVEGLKIEKDDKAVAFKDELGASKLNKLEVVKPVLAKPAPAPSRIEAKPTSSAPPKKVETPTPYTLEQLATIRTKLIAVERKRLEPTGDLYQEVVAEASKLKEKHLPGYINKYIEGQMITFRKRPDYTPQKEQRLRALYADQQSQLHALALNAAHADALKTEALFIQGAQANLLKRITTGVEQRIEGLRGKGVVEYPKREHEVVSIKAEAQAASLEQKRKAFLRTLSAEQDIRNAKIDIANGKSIFVDALVDYQDKKGWLFFGLGKGGAILVHPTEEQHLVVPADKFKEIYKKESDFELIGIKKTLEVKIVETKEEKQYRPEERQRMLLMIFETLLPEKHDWKGKILLKAATPEMLAARLLKKKDPAGEIIGKLREKRASIPPALVAQATLDDFKAIIPELKRHRPQLNDKIFEALKLPEVESFAERVLADLKQRLQG